MISLENIKETAKEMNETLSSEQLEQIETEMGTMRMFGKFRNQEQEKQAARQLIKEIKTQMK